MVDNKLLENVRGHFNIHPNVSHYYPALSHQASLEALIDCVENVEGIGLLVAPPGNGKSLLCNVLMKKVQGSFHRVVLNHTGFDGCRALLQCILFQLRQPYRGMDEQEVRLALQNFLVADGFATNPLLLIVDEAHLLNADLLEELRLLTNWHWHNHSLVRLVLAGNPGLEEKLTNPQLDSFNQRVSRRCYLTPFDGKETVEYITRRLQSMGSGFDHLFTTDAMEKVHRITSGNPRNVHLLCDETLKLSAARTRVPVTSSLVEEAWSELQQFSTPLSVETGQNVIDSRSRVVEFGSSSQSFDEKLKALPTKEQQTELEIADKGDISREFSHSGTSLRSEEKDRSLKSPAQSVPVSESWGDHETLLKIEHLSDRAGTTKTFVPKQNSEDVMEYANSQVSNFSMDCLSDVSKAPWWQSTVENEEELSLIESESSLSQFTADDRPDSDSINNVPIEKIESEQPGLEDVLVESDQCWIGEHVNIDSNIVTEPQPLSASDQETFHEGQSDSLARSETVFPDTRVAMNQRYVSSAGTTRSSRPRRWLVPYCGTKKAAT